MLGRKAAASDLHDFLFLGSERGIDLGNHLIGSVTVEPGVPAPDPEAGLPTSDVLVLSSAITAEYRLDHTRTFVGRQRHWLRHVDGALRIVRKRVDLVNCEAAFEAIAVPV